MNNCPTCTTHNGDEEKLDQNQRGDEEKLDQNQRKELNFIKELHLNADEYRGIFVEIFTKWNQYFDTFLKGGLMQICKTPQDLQRTSQALYPLFNSIYKLGDGSAQFLMVLSGEIEQGRIRSVDELIDMAQQLAKKNESYWGSGINPRGTIARDGNQFKDYLAEIRSKKSNRRK